MTDFELRALKLLVEFRDHLIGPGAFGDSLWKNGKRSSNCSCPYARPAGKVLNRLRALGFAEWQSTGSRATKNENWGWCATDKGKKEAKR